MKGTGVPGAHPPIPAGAPAPFRGAAAMELNRNQFFLLGLVILFLGLQFRLVDSFVLNERATRFLAERTKSSSGSTDSLTRMFPAMGPAPRKTLRPPQWLGWALASVGAVLVLHSMAMPKPAG